MAGLKKRKQASSGSPNIVLVIFTVFFFLLSIILGVFVYLGYSGQDEFKRGKDSALAEKRRETVKKEYWSALYRNLRIAVGGEELKADDLEKEDIKLLMLEDFGKDAHKFKDEDTKADTKKLIDDIKKDYLPGSDKDWKSDLFTQIKSARKDAEESKAKADQSFKTNKRLETYIAELEKRNQTFQADTRKDIKKSSDEQFDVVKERSKSFDDYVKKYDDTRKELKANQDETLKLKDDHAEVVKTKDREIALLQADLKKAQGGAGGGGQPGSEGAAKTFPLVLDISPGRPLWDFPIGEIQEVSMDTRQVVINLGHKQGAKPELTFNIFSPSTYNRAVGPLKGTIEIVKVINENMSLCRITSLYDSEGREIPLNDKRFQVTRETEAPLRKGDLLYNLFWGTRVAVAGYVSITGEPSNSAAEQRRQLSDFIHLLQRNGMTVDAYVDLSDGKVVGSLSTKTRYLIRGEGIGAPAAAKAEEGKEKEAGGGPDAERSDAFNKSVLKMREDATALGLLQISAENFAHVIGYRKARSANSTDPSGFRPGLPDAGTGRVIAAPAGDRPEEPAPKKDMDKKDMEKKDEK